MGCFMKCEPPPGGGGERFYVLALRELTVYGHSVDAWTREHYPEDWENTVWGYQHGYFFGCYHSVACPDGELGSNGYGLRQITYEEFMQAQEDGWPQLEDENPGVPVAAIYVPNDDGELVKVWDSLEGDSQ